MDSLEIKYDNSNNQRSVVAIGAGLNDHDPGLADSRSDNRVNGTLGVLRRGSDIDGERNGVCRSNTVNHCHWRH